MSVIVRLSAKIKWLPFTGRVISPINRNMSVSTINIPLPKTYQRLSYIHHTEDNQALVGLTMGQIIDQSVDRFGDRIAVIDRPQQIRKTFSQLHADIEKLATGFLALHLRKGERIGIWSPNRYEWIVTQMASFKMGLVTVPINAIYQPPEFEYCLKKLKLRALVAPDSFRIQDYYKIISKVIPEVSDSKPGEIKSKMHPYFDTLIMLSDKDIPGAFKYKDVLHAGGSNERAELKQLEQEIQFDDPLTIFFTSGTTGQPKAAVHTHFTVVNNCLGVNQRLGYNVQSRQHRICCPVPFFHVFGGLGVNCTMMSHGVGVILPAPGFIAEATLKAIEEEKCTNVYGTPTMFYDMMNHPNFNKTDLSCVLGGVVGGAACRPELFGEIMKNFDASEMCHGYGMTECSVLTVHDYSEVKDQSVGKILPNVEVKVVDENGLMVPFETQGEICIRGYIVQREYWDDEKSSKDAIKDNWLYSGDIGTLSEDGRLKITGRKKEMINRGGTKIFPAEVEDYLQKHPKIAEVNIIGVSDERMGEEVCAWVKLHDNELMSETDVKEFCKGQLSHFKIPRYVHFVKDFPRTAIGKPKKFVMRQEMEKILQGNKNNA